MSNTYFYSFDTVSAYDTVKETLPLPNISKVGSVTKYNSMQPLTIVPENDCTFTIFIGSGLNTTNFQYMEYSLDCGETWERIANVNSQTVIQDISIQANKKLLLRGKGLKTSTNTTSYNAVNCIHFVCTSVFDAYGRIMSLLCGDKNFNEIELSSSNSSAFNGLFYTTSVKDASRLILPRNVANYCYAYMFQNCSSLTSSPELPATTLADSCYQYMFYNCTSLTSSPELPATTLTNSCYSSMFQNCSSLTSAPELPATTLVSNCYRQMFQNCSSLNYIKALFTTTPGSSYTSNWVSGVSSTGTFVKNSAATWNVTGTSGVPSRWTVQTASA